MKLKFFLSILFILSFLISNSVSAQRVRPKNKKRAVVHRHKKVQAAKRFKRNRVVVVRPRRVRTVTVVPKGAVNIHFNKVDYHFHSGRYYRKHTTGFIAIAPPIGLRTRVLPKNNYRFTWRNRPYFYHSGVFYVYKGEEYEVSASEVGMVVPDLPEDLIEEVKIEDQTYYSLEGNLYKKHENGYEVIGQLEG